MTGSSACGSGLAFFKQTQPNPRPAQRAGHYIMTSTLPGETSVLPGNRPESAKLPLTAASHCFDERIGDFSTVDTKRRGKVKSLPN
jgi:hypothetical protein